MMGWPADQRATLVQLEAPYLYPCPGDICSAHSSYSRNCFKDPASEEYCAVETI